MWQYPERREDETFLAGGESRHWVHTTSPVKENESISGRKHNISGLCRSDIIRRGGSPDEIKSDPIIKQHKPFILESFFYVNEDTERLLPYFGDFMLDSGAFTFMQNNKNHVDWNEYIERYADFIKRNHIKKFFELDIDSVVGYEKVLDYRKRLEKLTGEQCIPVWHNTRGREEFVKATEEYSYVAMGGLVNFGAGEYARKYWKAFPWFINTAHKNNAKIHALGFTSLEGMRKYHFDSVDSTAWTTGNRFGYAYYFDGRTMQKKERPRGKKIADSRKLALHNYTEWIKFQKYAENNL